MLGNYIGVDVTGTKPLGNTDDGVEIDTGASGNTIGGSTAAALNVISANLQNGIAINSGAGSNTVVGNEIGTDLSGTVTQASGGSGNLGNAEAGIEIRGSSNNTIGGADLATPTLALAGAGNLISGNGGGIVISQMQSEAVSSGNLVLGNFIGTNVAGTQSLANSAFGVEINADNNTIGGTSPATRNIISGNTGDGVALVASLNTPVPGFAPHAPVMNTIQDNFIGTDVSGKLPLGNGGNGVTITGGSNNTIGGTTTAAGNLISSNSGRGVFITGSASAPATNNLVDGNIIGTDLTSKISLGNGFAGIGVLNASGNMIGGVATADVVGHPPGNAIAGNRGNGVFIQGALANGNFVGDNVIGLGTRISTGKPNPIPNAGSGIQIDSATGNRIGGLTAAGRKRDRRQHRQRHRNQRHTRHGCLGQSGGRQLDRGYRRRSGRGQRRGGRVDSGGQE